MGSSLPYLDPALSVPERVADLTGRMTLPEKIGQMLQLNAKDGVRHLIEDMHAGSILHASPDRVLEAAALTERTRLRIPLLVAEDCIHGHSFWEGATIYPTQLGMAATWDPELVERIARATAVEVAATGVHWTFSPVLCITRDLRWGRVSETFGEDPFLIGELASAMVRGYQGDGLDDPTAVLACAKHFAGYSETQGGRDASEADISRRKLRSWFLPPFERVAREGCRTFMLGYQSMDGVPITVNSWLLNEVLRGEWGYTGTLVTDWDNVGRMVWEQRVYADHAQAAAAAVRAGNDMVMTTPGFFDGAQEAVAGGTLDEAEIDAAVRRILTLKFELGLFENPRHPDRDRQAAVIGSAGHAGLNLEAARRSLVLLTNDGTLPLAAWIRGRNGRPRARRRRAAHGRGHRAQRRRRADPARRLGGVLRSGGLAAERSSARHDPHRAGRVPGARAGRLDRHPRARGRHPHRGARPPGSLLPRRAAPAGDRHPGGALRGADRRGRRRGAGRRLRRRGRR